ncbi:MAG: DegV family protein [Christensenellaceae bacterium]
MFIISAENSCDLSKEVKQELNIRTIGMNFYVGNKEYVDDDWESISQQTFYQALKDGARTSTSQINEDRYYDYFSSLIGEGDVLHVSLSSGISGTGNSARLAAERINAEGKNKVFVVDSLCASSGMGLLLVKACEQRDKGKSLEETINWVEQNKLNVNHRFFSTDLSTYVRGGRITKGEGWFGTLLKICPLLNVDNEGKLIPRQKICGKKKVYKVICERMAENAVDGYDYAGECFISHSNDLEDALAVKNVLEEKFHNLKGKIQIFDIGSTIGCHTGQGTCALFYMGNGR